MDIVDKAAVAVETWGKKSIDKTRAALQSSGTRLCIDCSKVIPEARRRAYPAAVRCITCQQEVENGRNI